MLAGKGIVEPVAKHAVIELPVAQPVAPATALHEVWRLIHVLHAAGDSDVGVAEQNLLGRRHNRLRPRTADAVHGHGWDRHRQAGVNRRLTRRIHPDTGLNDVAHRRSLDLLGLEPRAFDGGADGDGPEIRRWDVLETAAKGANRGADRFGNDN